MKHILFIIALFIIGTTISCTNENLLVEETQQINKVKFKLFTGSGKSRAALSDLSGEGYTAKITLRSSNGAVFDDTLSINDGNAEYNLAEGQYVLEQCEISKYDSLRYHLRDTVKFDVNEKRDSLYEPIDIYVDQITSCYFDWEKSTTVLNDPNLPLLPWVNGASTGVPRSISMDNKRNDGWELVHNNFKLTNGTVPDKRFLIFYNKYTGILRFWYYHQGSSNYSSLKYALQTLYPTSILNFNDDFAQPMDKRRKVYSEYYSGNDNVTGSLGLTNNTWYLFEFELSYDSSCTSVPSNFNDFMVSARGVTIDSLKITGSSNGKIDGKIMLNQKNGSNKFYSEQISIKTIPYVDPEKGLIMPDTPNPNSDDYMSFAIRSSNSEEVHSKIRNKITDKFQSIVTYAFSDLKNQAINLAKNQIGKFLNSLIHKGNTNIAYVNLSMSSKIDLAGSITSQEPISCSNMIIPGSKSEDIVYIYNKPLGVFNISTSPIVKYEQTYWKNCPYGPRYYQFFKLDKTSFNIVFNPAILNDIEVLSTNSYLLYYRRYEGSTSLNVPSELYHDIIPESDKVFETSYRMPIFSRFDDGYEFYTVREGTIYPNAGIQSGIAYKGDMIPSSYFDTGYKMAADKRIVVKVIVQFRIKASDQVVTIVKTYLPEFEDCQEMPIKLGQTN